MNTTQVSPATSASPDDDNDGFDDDYWSDRADREAASPPPPPVRGMNELVRRGTAPVQIPPRDGGAEGQLLTDLLVGDAVELSEELERDLRGTSPVGLVYAEGSFRRYDPACGAYLAVPAEEPRHIVSGYSRRRVGAGRTPRMLAVSRRLIQDTVAICADRLSAETPDFFKGAVPGVAFRNVFVALTEDGVEVRPHSSDHRARHALPFDYDPEAPRARWERFLTEVFPPLEVEDQPAIADGVNRAGFLQEFLGACLFGQATRYGTAVALVGEGANGKSVFLKVVAAPFPSDAVASIAPQRWSKPTYLADLAGKLLNAVSEMPVRDIAESDIFKAVVTGDALTADRKYEAPFRFAARAGHLFACNALPATRDHSQGFWRRFGVVHFNATFTGREDPKLDERLIADELPGVVAWMVEGARRVFAAGRYAIPPSSVQAKKDWQADADQVQEFVEECLTPTKPEERESREGDKGCPWNAKLPRELYVVYQRWAQNSGHRSLSNKEFGKRVKRFLLHSRNATARFYYCVLSAGGQPFGWSPEPTLPKTHQTPPVGEANNLP